MALNILFYLKDSHGGTASYVDELNTLIHKNTNWYTKIITHFPPITETRSKFNKIGFITPKLSRIFFAPFIIYVINFIVFIYTLIKFQPDIIISVDLYANFASILYCFFVKRTKVIISTHINLLSHIESSRSLPVKFILRTLIRVLYPFAKRHVVSSYELRNQLIKSFSVDPKDIISIPHPINISRIQGLAKKKIQKKELASSMTNKTYFKIFTMARFNTQKDLSTLLKSVTVIKKHQPNTILYVLGTGSLKQHYLKLITTLSLSNNVVFLGWQRNPFMYLKYADLFILSTHYECFPYSLLEALALGLPVIASDVDFGPREILDKGKYGFLVPPNNKKALTKVILKCIQDPTLLHNLKIRAIQGASRFRSSHIWPAYYKLIKY